MASKTILTDGTFPKIALQFEGLTVNKNKFYQMVFIQSILEPGEVQDDQLLMLDAVILLPDKQRVTYDVCFESVIKIAREDCPGTKYTDKSLLTDAEFNLKGSAED